MLGTEPQRDYLGTLIGISPEAEQKKPAVPKGRRFAFDPELRRFVLMQHGEGQVAVPRLTPLLAAMGISIAKRQVLRALIVGPDDVIR